MTIDWRKRITVPIQDKLTGKIVFKVTIFGLSGGDILEIEASMRKAVERMGLNPEYYKCEIWDREKGINV